MVFFPVFLSVVFVVRNQSNHIGSILADAVERMSTLVSDYELIVVDNASDDDSISILKSLTGENGLPNLQVYALTKEVDADTASWAGLENALGDFVAVIDPLVDDIAFLPEMLDKAVSGADVVFAKNKQKPAQSLAYEVAYSVFNKVYKSFNGIHLATEAPQYRVLSKRVINFILQHPQPSVTYRHLPATGGFARANLNYSSSPRVTQKKRLREVLIGACSCWCRPLGRPCGWLLPFRCLAQSRISFTASMWSPAAFSKQTLHRAGSVSPYNNPACFS